MSSSAHNGDASRTISTRPLVIHVGAIRVSIPVSTEPDQWIAAEVLRDDFVHSQSVLDAAGNATELEDPIQREVQLFARFLAFTAERTRAGQDAPDLKARLAVLLKAVAFFSHRFLADIDLHSLVASYDQDTRKTILTAYYAAYATLQVAGAPVPEIPTPSLFAEAKSGSASIYALFGGQGINEVYFDELQSLFDTYRPFVEAFLTAATEEVLKPLAAAHEASTFYAHGLDVISWLTGAVPRPPIAYFASVPVSFPLIGLTQFAQYLIAARVSGLSLEEFRSRFSGASGHSQGLATAAAIAATTDEESFVKNASKALKWLFFAGFRGQQLFPVLAVEPNIVQDSVESGVGTPSPMLSVVGLSLKELQPHVVKTNKHLASNSQLTVSLHNGTKAFVVTGPPKALYGLVASLKKVQAPSGAEQSKVPFSQRKPTIFIRFLVVGVPYHSDYLKDAAAKVCEEDLNGEELWSQSELQLAVFNTEDGSDLRQQSGSLIRSISDQIFTQPLHWTKATDLPESATHAIDFGPGGLSGIGPMTARNLDGRGIRVIVLGEKGKGDAELFSVGDVKYDQSWTKKWSPKLVKTSDGKVHVDTPFTRLLGKPPIMVAGMTPTTVKAGFVSAVLSAGYHVELAGGGHYSPAALRAKVAEIQTKIPEGVGLTLNALYINPRQFTFQYPLWQEMRKEGLPIEGFCVAAGIPTTEGAVEIIDGLKAAGIRHISFKPGSVDGIRQVVNIASANPDFPIIMQWTGGQRWVDISLRNLTGDWLRRIEERFAGVNGLGKKASILQSYTSLDSPGAFVEEFFKACPLAAEQLLASEDKAFFMSISQRPGQKPVPFIPVLDATFEVWFKKDSLWPAEDIEAVFDQDPERVCILQGPVAVKHAVKKDEPIKEILDNVTSALVARLLERSYSGDESKVPVVDYLGAVPAASPAIPGLKAVQSGDEIHLTLSSLPKTEDWLELLAGAELNWWRALISSPTVVQGKSFIDNPLRRLFAPRLNQKVALHTSSGVPDRVALYGGARSYGEHKADFKAVEVKYNASTHVIDVTLFEDRRDSSVSLPLQFVYKPSEPYAPIHEVSQGRNQRIKEFYWRLWFGDNEALPVIDVRDTFTGPEVTISAADVETFCGVVGNQQEEFKTVRSETVKAPMDFAIVTGWQAIMKAIFPASIDGDLLKLVHLSNGFKVVPGAKILAAGDVCKAEAKVTAVVNSDAGKTVRVQGHVLCEGKPVIEVVSAFLYRGRFTDFENTFETVEEPDYIVTLASDADVGVLQSKEWFQWADDTKPLQAGTALVFRLKSEVTYKDKVNYRSVAVEGDVFVRDALKQLVKVGSVAFDRDECQGNPVVEYLKRHGEAQGKAVPLASEYTLTTSDVATSFQSPATNEPYSQISGDFNPIHINPYFADYASLPGTITHGMWSSAATRRFVETVVAQGHPERVLKYNVAFVGMILPGDELTVALKHTCMREGNMVVKVATSNQRGEKVLEGTAEVAQPPTVYVFTGQGSQEPGMGMDLYNNSPAARAVWEGADEHLLAVYGFSIVDIVKNNPKEKTIHFGGIKGQAIRQRYMDMTYDAMDKDGNIKTLPLFSDINVRTPQYTFSHPSGLPFATQFAQIALVVTERAALEDMRSKGLVQQNCAFAGHSLGEYSALASIADVLPTAALVDVVFYRGITMQRAVERDAHNRSNYAMCAVNPSRISKTFSDAALREVVDTITQRTGCLLEIVNYNVEGQQYVCAGELVALQALTNVLNYLKIEKVDIAKASRIDLTEKFSLEKVKEMLGDIVENCSQHAQEQQKLEGYIKLEHLSKKVNPAQLNPDMLEGKYVPNLVAKPFAVTKEYAQLIYDQTSSPRLSKVLKKWDEEHWGDAEQRQKLAYTILVELLAYQFASPVRWIETQDLLFTHFKFERFIEIGPSPTLTGMATRTLKAKYETQDDSTARSRVILCHSKNGKEIYYQFEDEPEAPAETESSPAAPSSAAAAAPAAAATPAAAPSGPVATIEDVPIKAVDILAVVVAQKLKKQISEVPLSKSIKDLSNGKSTLQNEILGDLGAEFASPPEKGEELPLEELGAALASGHSGTLGKYTSGLVSRMVGGKMPGGFNISAIKAHLSKTWGLGPSRADGVLLIGTTMEPPKRLASEAEGKAWVDSVAASYAQRASITLSSGGGGGGAGGASGGAVMNSEEFLKFKAEQEQFAGQQVELYMRYLKRDSRAGEIAADKQKDSVAALQARLDSIAREHGDTYIDGIQPSFDALKARHFDSSWNWVRQDALLMFYDIIFGRLTTVDREITARCIAIMNRADPELITYMQYAIDQVDPTKGDTYSLAKKFGQQLIDNCREVVGEPPLYKDVTFPTAPKTEVNATGEIIYSEVVRENVRKLEAYVEEMASTDNISGSVNIQKIQDDVLKLWNVVKSQPEISEDQKNRIKALYDGVVRTLRKTPESPRPRPGTPRSRRSSSQFLRPQVSGITTSVSADKVPLLHLKRKVGTNWEYSSNLTGVYLDVLHEIATSGTTFKDKNALLTGVGKGSIGVEILKGLLSGGAHVVITTSRYSRAS
ncbi:acyl transferase domain-containing protein, partial [Amylostereum chailletii]